MFIIQLSAYIANMLHQLHTNPSWQSDTRAEAGSSAWVMIWDFLGEVDRMASIQTS